MKLNCVSCSLKMKVRSIISKKTFYFRYIRHHIQDFARKGLESKANYAEVCTVSRTGCVELTAARLKYIMDDIWVRNFQPLDDFCDFMEKNSHFDVIRKKVFAPS